LRVLRDLRFHFPCVPTDRAARLFVLEGSVTLVFGTDRVTYGPGDSCNVPAGTMHEEHTEADGVRYLAGRRSAASQAAAE
jgi:mannose-6-phosphate isomerase-like protein (cupin superfamily)